VHLVHVVEAFRAPEKEPFAVRVRAHQISGDGVALLVAPDTAQRLHLHHRNLNAAAEVLFQLLDLLAHLHVLLPPQALRVAKCIMHKREKKRSISQLDLCSIS